MRRRTFLLTSATAALSSPALAQQGIRKVGFVSWGSSEAAGWVEEFRRGLREFGYIEGRDVTVEPHYANGDRERARAIVRKLVQEKADILVVVATPAIAAAKQDAGSLPIVMASVSDPIAAGFARSLSQPGGNLTGRTMFGPELAAKRIDMIREIRPGLRTIAFLGSLEDPNTVTFVRGTQAETDRSGLKLAVHLVSSPKAIDLAAFEAMRRDGAEAVIVQPIFSSHQRHIMPLANQAGLPVVADFPQFAEGGAVLTYGIDQNANMRRAAYFVDRIFRGVSPGDLPIEQPTETKLVINVGAAKRFGWTIPPALLARADEVIE